MSQEPIFLYDEGLILDHSSNQERVVSPELGVYTTDRYIVHASVLRTDIDAKESLRRYWSGVVHIFSKNGENMHGKVGEVNIRRELENLQELVMGDTTPRSDSRGNIDYSQQNEHIEAILRGYDLQRKSFNENQD